MAITRRGVFVSGSAIAALSTLYDAAAPRESLKAPLLR
jgi:hypothetical protein